MRTLFNVAAAAAASLALAACGGGSDYDSHSVPLPAAPTAVPDNAIVSAPALVSYLAGQSFSDETSEPLTLPAGDPVTSETDEPSAIS
ncbi:hypothetical protein [Roseateles sp. P5_E7]